MSQIQREMAMKFHEHLRHLSLRRPLDDRDAFDDEMNELQKVDRRVRTNLDEFYTASLGTNIAKNRFVEVKANEGTLVRCSPLSNGGEKTYINANYVDGRALFKVPFTYIATQGPLSNTVFDFWRMVCENNVFFIVMLCGEMEGGKVKSYVYWPKEGGMLDFGLLRVRTLSETRLFDLVFRTLSVCTARGEERRVQHMQYLGWPDQGIPNSSASLMEIIQSMGKSECSLQAPIVVHCSGGIGRTGVFIALHVVLAQFQLERDDIDVQRVVHTLRLCRSGMVQRKDQYVFLHYSVMREMDRMILSAEKGINLLKLRRRESLNRRAQSRFSHVDKFSAASSQPLSYAGVELRPVERGGKALGRNITYSQTSTTGLSEAEEQLLENYIKQRLVSAPPLTSTRRMSSYRDSPLNSGRRDLMEIRTLEGGTMEKEKGKGGGDDKMPPAGQENNVLEEQLRQWKNKNRRMRFSMSATGSEEIIQATERDNTRDHSHQQKDQHRHHQRIMRMETGQEAVAPSPSTSVHSVVPVSIIVSPMEVVARSTNPDPLTHAGVTSTPSHPCTAIEEKQPATKSIATVRGDVSLTVGPPQHLLSAEEYERL